MNEGPQPLLVSVSGGRSSALMARTVQIGQPWDAYEKHYLFANTGKEREETLAFVDTLAKVWGLPIVWLECVVNPVKGQGTRHRIVNFETASRNGEPFDAVIRKYGIPNKAYQHCTREMKIAAMASYMRSLGYRNWTTAMGMRIDEPNRMKGKTDFGPTIYPLADMKLTRQEVAGWWDRNDFDLEIEDREGNCDLCFKKSLAKRLRIIRENPAVADWWAEREADSDRKFDIRDCLTIPEQVAMANGAPIPANVDVQLEFSCFCN